MDLQFVAELWEWESQASWFFVSLPKDTFDDIREIAGVHKKGFGSVRVKVAVGGSQWKTSIFPDTSSKTFVLPVKKAVRSAEKLEVGDTLVLSVELLV